MRGETKGGPQALPVKVSDGHGGFATQFYTIEVSAVLGNRVPIFTSTPSSTRKIWNVRTA
jgi:hypothetical protein